MPTMIRTMGQDACIIDAWHVVVDKKVSEERLLSDIYATAVDSVRLPVHPDSDAVRMFRLVLTEGWSLVRQRNEIEAPGGRAALRVSGLSVADKHSRHRSD